MKNRFPVATTISKAQKEKLQRLSELTRIPQARLIEEALTLLFENHEGKAAGK